jgi:ribosomal protein L23
MRQYLAPHITEKSYKGYNESDKEYAVYTFKVNSDLDKNFLTKLIEKQFNVKIDKARIINLPGKKRVYKNIPGTTSTRSKLIVRLKKGDRIEAFENKSKTEESTTEAKA